jgi:hypothetical protein
MPGSIHPLRDKPDYRGLSLVLSFACRPMHIVAIYLLRSVPRGRHVSRFPEPGWTGSLACPMGVYH